MYKNIKAVRACLRYFSDNSDILRAKMHLSIVIIGVFQSAYFVLLSYVTALSYSAEVSFNLGLIKPFSLELGLSILSIIKNKIN